MTQAGFVAGKLAAIFYRRVHRNMWKRSFRLWQAGQSTLPNDWEACGFVNLRGRG
jgi:hypothetical protein